ncbi:MAG: ester cyclase [Dehalococcoidia bacterium]|nr:ester cyclase [Dehalococcoidia bacterium]
MSDAASIAREYNDAWNRRDWARYRELLHPEYTYTGGDGQTQKGQDVGLAVGQMFATAFPDGRIDVQSIHAAGNVAIVEFIGRGSHTGDLMGIAPTGRQMTMPVCDILEIRDGKIYAEREYMDMLHMMQQLGVAPAPATA